MRQIHDKFEIETINEKSFVMDEPFVICNNKEFIKNQFLENRQKINLFEKREHEFFEYFFEYIDENYNDLVQNGTDKLTFCHNDYGIRNILKNGNELYLIDFESAFYAEREFDVANVFFDYYLDNRIASFISGYCADGFLLNQEKVDLYLILKCIDICGWAKERAIDYYNKAIDILRDIKMRNEECSIWIK